MNELLMSCQAQYFYHQPCFRPFPVLQTAPPVESGVRPVVHAHTVDSMAVSEHHTKRTDNCSQIIK